MIMMIKKHLTLLIIFLLLLIPLMMRAKVLWFLFNAKRYIKEIFLVR